ncbi:MAG: kinase, partial [Brevundimonas sp.]
QRRGFKGRPRAVLVDGWLIGATPQDADGLAAPVNALERTEDPDGVWRRAANARLAEAQALLNTGFDAVLFLKAPGFEVVLDWRCEQEAGLRGIDPSALGKDDRADMARFIAHFERITGHMLAGGVRAATVVRLDRARRVMGVDTNGGPER